MVSKISASVTTIFEAPPLGVEPVALITVATVISATGSTPRGGASKMVVTEAEIFDTIGWRLS